MKLAFFLSAFICFTVSSANAADIPNCPTPAGSKVTTALWDLPTPVADSLHQLVPNLKPTEAVFNGGDAPSVGQVGLDRRFIRAFNKGNRWVIGYEAAGRAYNVPILVFDLANNTATVTAKATSNPALVCADMTRLLDSAPGQP